LVIVSETKVYVLEMLALVSETKILVSKKLVVVSETEIFVSEGLVIVSNTKAFVSETQALVSKTKDIFFVKNSCQQKGINCCKLMDDIHGPLLAQGCGFKGSASVRLCYF
jgi:hypothetical protein